MDVEANLNYILDSGKDPVLYVDWPEEEHKACPPSYEERKCNILDGRIADEQFALNTHGFTFINHPSNVENFYDQHQIETSYSIEVERLIKDLANAKEVIVFDHTFRTSNSSVAKENNTRAPVKSVHNDYTPESARQRVQDLLPAKKATKILENRFAIIQTWRPINHIVESEPLAIGDGRTLKSDNFIVLQRRYSYRTAETYHLKFNPLHQFYYFPYMNPKEVIVFKVFDSDVSKGVPFTAHTAFDDPNTSPKARPRESIESRALVFF